MSRIDNQKALRQEGFFLRIAAQLRQVSNGLTHSFFSHAETPVW